jgi:uncharacterized delta-60 repeat protein
MKRLAISLLVGAVLGLPCSLIALTPGSIDPSFRSGFVRNGVVRSLVRQPDGRILIAGRFETVQGQLRSGIARLLPDGRLDATFNPGLALNGGGAYRIALQADGKILVAGDFTAFHLAPFSHLVRLLPNGALDPTFNCTPNAEVHAVVPLADGRILISGAFTQVHSTARNRVARLNPNGSLDTAFSPGSGAAGGSVIALAVSGSQYYLGGNFSTYGGVSRPGVARVNSNGSLDTGFNPGSGTSGVQDIALDSDSRPVIVGGFVTYNGASSPGIARLNLNGTRDTSFAIGSGIPGFVTRIRILPSGVHVLAGSFSTVDGVTRRRAARLGVDGSLDPSFNLGPNVEGELYDILPIGGSFLLGGSFNVTGGQRFSMSAQVGANGRPSAGFNMGTTGEFVTINHSAAQPDGKVLIAGGFTSYAGAPRRALARIFANGRLDPSFNARTGPSGQILDSVTQPDGRIIVVGTFSAFDGVPLPYIARLLPNGRVDPTFVPGSGGNGIIQAVALAPDGRIYVGGNFTTWNGFSRGRLARLLPDGTLDTTYSPTGVAGPLTPYIAALAVEPGSGDLTIGGNFSTCNSISRPNLARLFPTGVLDSSFNTGTGPNSAVLDLHLLGFSSSVLIAGDFTSYNGSVRNRIALVGSDGTLNTALNPGTGFDAPVYELDIQLSDRILAVGEFTTYNGNSSRGLVRLESNGDFDDSFQIGNGTPSQLYTVAALPSGRVLVGGEFGSFDNQPQAGIVTLLGNLDATGSRFVGALQPSTGAEVAGSFSLMVTAGNVFTGVIRQAAQTTTFRGAFDFEGNWSGFFRRGDGVEVAAYLAIGRSTAGYNETLIIGNYLSPEGGGLIVAFKPYVPTGGRLAAGLTGYYTATLRPTTTGDPTRPEGTGLLTITQGSSGPARLAGTTADGRAFTASTAMGSGGLVVLHANLSGGRGGYLSGNLLISNTNPIRPINNNLVWHRRSGPAPYADGFTQNVTAEGSLYLRPETIFLDLADATNNARLTLDLGHLPASINRLFTIDSANRVTPNAAGSLEDPVLTVNSRTGLISGSFLPPGNTRRANLRGIATSFPKIGRGYSLFTGPAAAPPLRSARFSITAP